MKRYCIIVGSLAHIPVSAVQTAVHRGKRKMRGLASNRKTAMRTHSGQSRACQDNKGWDKVYTIKKKCNLAFRSGPQTTKNMFLLSLMGEKQQRAFTCLGPKPTTMVRVVGLSAQIWTEMRQATVRCWSYCQDTASSAFFILIFYFSSQLKTSLVVNRVSSEQFREKCGRTSQKRRLVVTEAGKDVRSLWIKHLPLSRLDDTYLTQLHSQKMETVVF